MVKITGALRKLAEWMNYVAMAACFVMMCLMTADVIGRYFFRSSILGSYELTENIFAIIVGFTLAYCQVQKRHIHVDVVTNALPYRLRKIIEAIISVACCAFLFVLARAQIQQTIDVYNQGIKSTVLQFKLWPFNLCLAIGICVFFLTFLADVIVDIIAAVKGQNEEDKASEPAWEKE